MLIKQVKATNMFDVFLGSGWFNHTRVLAKGKHITFLSGKPLKAIQYVEISKTIGERK